MIVDSHSHAWSYWPYQPTVPDPESRGTVEQLLWEMDRNEVATAVIVCAGIDHNENNNDYVFDAVQRFPDRLVQFADVDCSWSKTYHSPGSADRLREKAKRFNLKGFTHYLKSDVEWFASKEANAFFTVAAEENLIASVALGSNWQESLRVLARNFPSVNFLCHHMAGARVSENNVEEILRSSDVENIFIKLSGFHYVSLRSWEYPYLDVNPIVRKLYANFGGDRLCWGSDYPVVRFNMTYRHALESFSTHCPFVCEEDKKKILGKNMDRLLKESGT
ncbi:MAG: hypothetical protein CME10_10685 [Gemmatimonadetes bacterium]|nr:hypothetical protein [Gemmatimonadota bacterium]